MSLNLIEDAWIPVICMDGTRRVIAPWQMADTAILRPDWPRPDLNLACYELLIGLLFLADPPRDVEDWEDRQDPDPARLKARLAPYAPAFNLLGEGPRFLQDLEPLEGAPNAVDMLFIDSAGASTAKNNADLMVHRGRYGALDLPFAAMALFAFQAFAPSGGAGNRTSMRGGGPLVTLIDPQAGLWPLIWANVPYGAPGEVQDLPWMRPTRVSDKGLETFPPEGKTYGVEAFFGMPRRLRLVAEDGQIVGVVQRPWGTNYAKWKHPLSPYYRMKPGEEWLPVHPRAGRFGYRNWLGVIAGSATSETRELGLMLRERGGAGTVVVAGWAMDNMKPRDFIWSEQPLLRLEPEAEWRLEGMVRAAEAAAVALRGALEPVLAGGEAREAEREAFFAATEGAFRQRVDAMIAGADVSALWLADLRAQALTQFEALALPELALRDTKRMEQIVEARKFLATAFKGYGKLGKEMFGQLGLEVPVAKKGKAA
ncbi:type I-E CRISPR-associated protein Cse1/CasA [Pseudodonghicola xiamenensis]|uniref:Type I-E CRISPR-associated protein Cse1/CasA n=1 Tax=Pseudodonghicola xiamenensis TaxID=337702 RepID=A0A8J3HBE8_9RHOB|nr:type I-E CRISPR-associated protein Cse1/CasA [Pseudodonghicola xiamenensis]GHG98414.1 type I-E CRISPR-associated protein Cse1/CasA [Pseudodonghicola xiamenensis]